MANYKERLKLELNKPVKFPDFTVEFIREWETPVEGLVIDHYTYFDYKITSPTGHEQVVTFGSGLGNMVPHKFIVDGKTFSLMGPPEEFRVAEGHDYSGACFY